MEDVALFVAFPYVAVILAVVVGLYRYFTQRFSYSSLSSQFLEGRWLFWGSTGWHYGIVIILLAHALALLLPGPWAALVAAPARLYALEVTGVALTLWALVGLVALMVRRLRDRRVRSVTSVMDWVLGLALVAQVALGLWVAVFYRWGTDWFLHTAIPWLVSLATFRPQVQNIAPLPWPVKLHMVGGFVIVALFPFTRLVHLVTLPIGYLWRPYQVVLWSRRER